MDQGITAYQASQIRALINSQFAAKEQLDNAVARMNKANQLFDEYLASLVVSPQPQPDIEYSYETPPHENGH